MDRCEMPSMAGDRIHNRKVDCREEKSSANQNNGDRLVAGSRMLAGKMRRPIQSA
jgi:hypothetical protein